jgi:hypothetical protein
MMAVSLHTSCPSCVYALASAAFGPEENFKLQQICFSQPGRDGHRAVRPPELPQEPPFGRGSAERNDYHAAHMLQLQMLQMRRIGQLMTHFSQTQQQIWDMGSRNGMGMPSMQNMQNMQHM